MKGEKKLKQNESLAFSVRKLKKKVNKNKILLDNISLDIKRNTLVAIIGPSGAGKTTFLKSLCDKEQFESGTISYYNQNGKLQETMPQFGYVPQENIIHEELKLKEMLFYYAKLNLPKKTKNDEIYERIDEVLQDLDIKECENQIINSLSGGEKKRANMAAELLRNPEYFFLDEPNTGLDPYTEKKLVETLKKLTNKNKTIIFVSHSLSFLDMCDQVIVIGKGGKLCFSGTTSEIKEFFNDNNYINIYGKVQKETEKWQKKFTRINNISHWPNTKMKIKTAKKDTIYQFKILTKRYIKLLLSDKKNLILLFLQAPVFALAIKSVTREGLYTLFWDTQEILFAFVCSGIWMGLFNSLREICKELNIVKCETKNNVSLVSYILSKLVVIGVICLIQSITLVLGYSLLEKFPTKSIFTYPIVEIIISVFLITITSSCMGLMFSTLFKNQNRVMTIAPYLLIPHLLFSGVLYQLNDKLLILAKFIIGYWGTNALSISSHLTELSSTEETIIGGQFDGMKFAPPLPEKAYITNNFQCFIENWGALILGSIIMSILCYYFLKRNVKD